MNTPHPMVAAGDLFKVHTKKYGWYVDVEGRNSACMEPDDLLLVLTSDQSSNSCVIVHNGHKSVIDKHVLWQIARLEKP